MKSFVANFCKKSSSNNQESTRKLALFLFGMCYSTLICYLIIYRVQELTFTLKLALFVVVFVSIQFGMAFFVAFRCVMTLSVLSFGSNLGKLMLTSWIIVTLIDGPIQNTFSNLQQLSSSLVCQYNLLHNLTKMVKSKHRMQNDFIRLFKKSHSKMNQSGQNINVLLASIDSELNSYEETSNIHARQKRSSSISPSYQSVYLEKNVDRCASILRSGEKNCVKNFRTFKENCYDSSFWTTVSGSAHCNLINIDDFKAKCSFANLTKASSIEAKCRASFVNMDNWNELNNQSAALRVLKQNMSTNFHMHFEYITEKRKKEKTELKQRIAKSQLRIHEFRADLIETSRNIRLILLAIRAFSNYGFAFVFINSFGYHFNYLNDISFDNFYLTEYFEQIDSRRALKHKRTLLPLRKFEVSTLHSFDFSSLTQSSSSSMLRSINFYLNITLILFIFLSLGADFLLTDFIRIIKANSLVNYSLDFKTKMRFQIHGNGVVSNLYKSILNEINKEDQFKYHDSTRTCLPNHNQLESKELGELILYMLILVLLMLVEMHTKRFSRFVCSIYYPKREKQRTLWLYNVFLRKRVQFQEIAKRKLELKRINNNTTNDSSQIMSKFFAELTSKSRLFNHLLLLIGIDLNQCSLCENSLVNKRITCAHCSIIYCKDCWLDLKQTCPSCLSQLTESRSQ
jgi:hypothetical protein